MTTVVSHLADVHPRAVLGDGVQVGPFCKVGPHVTIGDGTVLDSNVVIVGHTTVGENNRFFAGSVIGGEPQDVSYRDSGTRLEIGDGNIFREGVTVNRGAEKEDHTTRVGHRNMLMANSHVAHNCHVHNNVILVNGVLLGGHVHVHDRAIISGNAAVHHFSTVGTLAFIGGASKVIRDIPPYMLAAGGDEFSVRTINIVGMQRNGISQETIAVIKRAHRLLFREHKTVAAARETLQQELDDVFPFELTTLLNFIEQHQGGRMGRGRDLPRKLAAQEHERGEATRRRAA
ncbi:MAG: acyl-ACP--UDP-N-acetylglucosamine O-acyltransferase [Planctomycetaceae bacterium]